MPIDNSPDQPNNLPNDFTANYVWNDGNITVSSASVDASEGGYHVWARAVAEIDEVELTEQQAVAQVNEEERAELQRTIERARREMGLRSTPALDNPFFIVEEPLRTTPKGVKTGKDFTKVMKPSYE